MNKQSKRPVHSGGRKATPGPKQKEAHQGRKQNREHKASFKDGAFVRNDRNAGKSEGPLVPLHQVEVKPARKAKP
jgi:hypothetical protein